MINLEDFIVENRNGKKIKKYHVYCDKCGCDRGYIEKGKSNHLCRSCASKDRARTPESREKTSNALKEYHKKWREEHPDYKEKQATKRKNTARIKELPWKRLRRELSSRDKKYPEQTRYDFTDEEIQSILEQPCYYCGDVDDIGLDRIDNSIGHCKTNCIPCCVLCNLTRGNRFSVEEFKMIGDVIKNIKEIRKNNC